MQSGNLEKRDQPDFELIMKNTENKPHFIDLYSRVIEYVEPFFRSIIPKITWSVSDWDERIVEQEKAM